MEEKEKKELAAGLKNKRRRKYILAILAVFICVSAVVGLSIEGKDAKLPDGQGNIVVGQDEADGDKSAAEDNRDGTEAAGNKAGDKAEGAKETQKEKLSQLTDEEK